MESYSIVRQGNNRKAVIPEAFQLRAIQRTSGRVRGNFFVISHDFFLSVAPEPSTKIEVDFCYDLCSHERTPC